MNYVKVIMYLIISINIALLIVYVFWRGFYFFRNPARNVPKTENAVISPADGKIIYVKAVEKGMCPVSIKNEKLMPLTRYTKFGCLENKDYYLIGIYMSVLDVHYNRSPIEGNVKMQDYLPGFNVSMISTMVNLMLKREPYDKMGKYLLQNARNLLWIEGKDMSVGVVQIADAWISKIKSFVEEGKKVEKGEVIGLIKMGSQVDLLIPADKVNINCKVGQRVKAGESILAYIKDIDERKSEDT